MNHNSRKKTLSMFFDEGSNESQYLKIVGRNCKVLAGLEGVDGWNSWSRTRHTDGIWMNLLLNKIFDQIFKTIVKQL